MVTSCYEKRPVTHESPLVVRDQPEQHFRSQRNGEVSEWVRLKPLIKPLTQPNVDRSEEVTFMRAEPAIHKLLSASLVKKPWLTSASGGVLNLRVVSAAPSADLLPSVASPDRALGQPASVQCTQKHRGPVYLQPVGGANGPSAPHFRWLSGQAKVTGENSLLFPRVSVTFLLMQPVFSTSYPPNFVLLAQWKLLQTRSRLSKTVVVWENCRISLSSWLLMNWVQSFKLQRHLVWLMSGKLKI